MKNKKSTGFLMALIMTGAVFSASGLMAWDRGYPDCPAGERGYYHHKGDRSYGKRFNRERRPNRAYRAGTPVAQELRRLDAMKARLKLTDRQVKKIFDINTKYREKFFNAKGDVDKLAQLRLDRRKEVKSVLTEKQKKELDNFRNFRGGRGQRCYGW